MQTLLLDPGTWDLVIDSAGNIAVASDPYSQAQDAASEIKVFSGEHFLDTTLGLPYFPQILGEPPPLSLIKSGVVAAAESVPGVQIAAFYVTSFKNRVLKGQVQISNDAGQPAAVGV